MFSHPRKHWFIIGLVVYSFLNILILNGDRLYAAKLPPLYLLVVIGYLCYGIWYMNLSIQKKLVPSLPKIHPIVVQFIISVGGIVLLSVLSVLLTVGILGEPFRFIQQNVLLTVGFTFRVNLFLNSINAVYFYNQKYREKELEAEKLKSSTLTAQYFTLQNQVNPHFLFNNLNAISTLVKTDVLKADQYIQKLAEVYRYLLKTRSEELVDIADELNFVKEYVDLLRLRYGHALDIQIGLNRREFERMIPPTVLQLLLENVVKHNYFTENEPIRITLKDNIHTICVSNSLNEKKSTTESFGVGLKNIKERYQFFGKEIEISKTKDQYKVDVPLIKTTNEDSHPGR